jgi:hypothetical protein
MTQLKEFFTEEQRKKVNVDKRNYGIGRQYGELIAACYKMPANITKIDGKLVSVYFYRTKEKFAPSLEKGKVVMIKTSKSDCFVEYTVEEFINKYKRK